MKIEIKSTTNYDLFVAITANREIIERHVVKLTEAIRRKNLLSVCPIICSEKMEVIDGQHRIEAAKRLKVPIYYIFGEQLDHLDIISLNNVKIKWRDIDYINFYCIKKYSKYMDLVKIMNKAPDLSLRCVTCLLSESGQDRIGFLRSGELDTLNFPNFDWIYGRVLDYKAFIPTFYNDKRFVLAIRHLTLKELGFKGKYNHEKIIALLTEQKIHLNEIIDSTRIEIMNRIMNLQEVNNG